MQNRVVCCAMVEWLKQLAYALSLRLKSRELGDADKARALVNRSRSNALAARDLLPPEKRRSISSLPSAAGGARVPSSGPYGTPRAACQKSAAPGHPFLSV